MYDGLEGHTRLIWILLFKRGGQGKFRVGENDSKNDQKYAIFQNWLDTRLKMGIHDKTDKMGTLVSIDSKKSLFSHVYIFGAHLCLLMFLLLFSLQKKYSNDSDEFWFMNTKTTWVNEFAAAVTARPTPRQRQLGQQLGTFKLLPISLGSRTRSGKPQVWCR